MGRQLTSAGGRHRGGERRERRAPHRWTQHQRSGGFLSSLFFFQPPLLTLAAARPAMPFTQAVSRSVTGPARCFDAAAHHAPAAQLAQFAVVQVTVENILDASDDLEEEEDHSPPS